MALKIGDRCIIIHSHCGDEGAIVVITGYYSPWQTFEGFIWEQECDVIVRTLGGPLHSINTQNFCHDTHMERPYRSAWLRKMPDVPEEQEPKQVTAPKEPVTTTKKCKECEVCDG